LLYFVSKPLVKVLLKFNFSPNSVTTMSLLMNIFSCFIIYFTNSIELFVLFNIVSILLDYSDGQIARIKFKVRKNMFRFDHYSDLLKICITILSLDYYYQDYFTSFILTLFLIVFLLYTVINHDAAFYTYSNKKSKSNERILSNKIKAKFIITVTSFDGPMYMVLVILSLYPLGMKVILIYCILLFIYYIVSISKNLYNSSFSEL
jgi:phosphatidylglycerophosphate synthase